ncbi:MAG TPA: hypothetical protein PLI62_18925, partial [Spirochaetota bacterium]|nr:hypothetical protein [Spirochaetota bacterium]
AAANGTHEGTVLLRDEEAMLWQQLMEAKEQGLSAVYNLVASDIVYDGAGNSVTARIVQSLASQNSLFQEQLRTQQADTFTERKSQWVDTISFIQNRGEREWINSMNEFTNLWKKWRLSARDAINEGEKEWTAAAKDLNTKVNAWNAEAAEAVSAAGSEQIYNSLKEKLTGQLAGMYARIGINRDNMPDLKTGVEQTLARALASMPEGIGMLKDSADTVDTTAGFSEMLDLGLSGALFERYEREMSRFSDRMSVMQSVKMGEAAYQSYMAILKQFSDNLRGMNKSTSDSVKTNIRDAAPYIDAPFEQSKGCWKIRYIRSYSLATGRKYGSLVINDYSYYVNTTVFLKKLKGIEGDIDFSNPYTYEKIDPEELNLYISMEQEHLTKEINNVFCAGGRFEKHSGSEMQRLSQKFSEGYEKYVKGQAMVAGGWYSAPLAPGVPVNAITVAKVAGSIALSSAGCPWLAVALNSSLAAVEAKDGGLSWKQAAVQVGINAAITGLSMGAGSALAGSSQTIGSQLASAAASSAVSTTGNTLASCVDYESGGGFGFSKDRFTDNKTWSQAGLSFATSFAASAATIGMKQGLGIKSNLLATTATTSINTVSSNFTVGGDGSWNWGGWGNIDTQKAVITGVGSYVSSTATGNMRDPYMSAFAGSVINSYTTALTANMFERFGGRDFGDQYSLDRPVSVDTLSISVNQAYGDARSRIMSDGSHEAATPVDNRSFLQKIGDGFAGAGESILSIGKSLSDEVGDIVGDAKKIGSGVGDGLSYVGGKLQDFGRWAVNGISNLAESIGNSYFDDMNERIRVLAVQSANGTHERPFNLPTMGYGSEDFFRAKQMLGYYDDADGPSLTITDSPDGYTKQYIETSNDGSEKSIHTFNALGKISEMYEYYDGSKKVSDDVFTYDVFTNNSDNITF